jgi:hypothetical protein
MRQGIGRLLQPGLGFRRVRKLKCAFVVSTMRVKAFGNQALLQTPQRGVVQQLCGWRVAQVYNDVPERMWPVAKRSLMAHVARIESMVS